MNLIGGRHSWLDVHASNLEHVSWIYMLGVGVVCYATATCVLFSCGRLSKWRTKPADKEPKLPPARKMESHIQKIVNTGDVNHVSTTSSRSSGPPRLDVVALGMQCTRTLSMDTTQQTKSPPVTETVPTLTTKVVDGRGSNTIVDQLATSRTQSSTELMAAREYAVIDPIPLEFPHFPGSETFLCTSPAVENESGKSTPGAPDTLDVVSSSTMFTKLSAYLGSTLRRGA